MNIGIRIRRARQLAGKSQTWLADKINVSQTTLSGWETGDVKNPPREKVELAADALGIDREDLELGGDVTVHLGEDMGEIAMIPEYPVSVAAGAGRIVDDQSQSVFWPFPRRYFNSGLDRAEKNYCVIDVAGDSMEPTLRSGDKILVDLTRTNPAVPGIYVLNVSDMAVVKRIEVIPGAKPARVRVSSDNPLHKEYEVELSEISVTGWVDTAITRI